MENKEYGVTQKYDRNNYEKNKDKKHNKSIMEDYFKGKKIQRDRNGNIMHRDHKAAERKYGEKRASAHVMEPDHIDPLKAIHSRNKHRKYITDEDIRRVGQQKRNKQPIPKAVNASKRHLSNKEAMNNPKVRKTIDENMTKAQQVEFVLNGVIHTNLTDTQLGLIDSKGRIRCNFKESSTKVNEAFTKGLEDIKIDTTNIGTNVRDCIKTGSASALISFTVSGINNIVLVASGEKDLEQAIKDVGRDVTGSFVGAAGLYLAQRIISDATKNCGDSKIVKLLSKDLPIAEISVAIMVGNSVLRFIKNDISLEDCITEIFMNGLGALTYYLGMSMGGPVGAIVSTIVMGQISKAVIEYKQFLEVNEEKEIQINTIVRDALIEMEIQRCNLRNMIKEEFKDWDTAFNNGYKLIFISALENDVDGISKGIDSILSVFNEKSKFTTLNEFNEFFDDLEAVLTI